MNRDLTGRSREALPLPPLAEATNHACQLGQRRREACNGQSREVLHGGSARECCDELQSRSRRRAGVDGVIPHENRIAGLHANREQGPLNPLRMWFGVRNVLSAYDDVKRRQEVLASESALNPTWPRAGGNGETSDSRNNVVRASVRPLASNALPPGRLAPCTSGQLAAASQPPSPVCLESLMRAEGRLLRVSCMAPHSEATCH